MMGNVNGLSLDLLVHPGETIKEVLEEKKMSQEELAIRTEYSPKHISEVVRGKKDISSEFANRLEYALGIPASFWMNLQSNYDKEVFEINSLSNIEVKELNILKDLKDVIKFCENTEIIECNSKKEITVLNMRKFLNLNNLCSIPSLSIQQAAFRGSKANKVNVYVLYAWQKLCEYFTNKIKITNSYDIEKLKTKYEDIQINFADEQDIKILEYTDSNRVKTVKFGNHEISGVETRTLLGLKSTNFQITREDGKVKFTVKGYGHGVGMSQTGADTMAKQGNSYEDIIKHFYVVV